MDRSHINSNQSASILCIGDPHINNRNIRIVEKLHPELIRVAKEIKPDLIVVLGDVMHDFHNAKTPMLTKSTQILRDLSLIAKTLLLIGNHELINKTVYLTGIHPFTALHYWDEEKMVVVDTCCKEIIINDISFAAVPYVPNGRFNDALHTLTDYEKKEIRAIFAHQEFKNCDINGIPSPDGDSWPIDNPLVISGHIHKRHQPQKNIIYIGTPYQENFSEMDEKSISHFIFTPTDYEEKRVYLDLPKRIELTIKSSEAEDWEVPADKLVKLTIVGTSAENAVLRKSGIIKKLETKGVAIVLEDIENEIDNFNNEQYEAMIKDKPPKFSDVVAKAIERKKYLHPIHAEITID